jgi:two-component sensor histidine kinase
LTLPDLSHNGATEAATSVVALLQAILAPHEHTQASRIAITGSNVSLSRNALTSLALLVHELTTNAAKYGALSSPCGQLTIDIETIGELLHVRWDERGTAPLAEAFQREGFGTILEKAVLKGLGGTISRDWRSNGLALSLKIPLERLAS